MTVSLHVLLEFFGLYLYKHHHLLQWRVISPVLGDNSKGIRTFSHEKHYILSQELKNLYVAITRARQHIWIFDEDAERVRPVQSYWENRNLVKVIESLDEIGTMSALAKKSTKDEWNKQGKAFFEKQKYDLVTNRFRVSIVLQ